MAKINRPKAKVEEPAAIIRLYVSGKFMAEGNQLEMERLFEQECASHSAIVELRKDEGVVERTIRKRKYVQR